MSDRRVYTFGPFRLDAEERVLLLDGEHVSLTPKAFATLLLVEKSGHVVKEGGVDEGGLAGHFCRRVEPRPERLQAQEGAGRGRRARLHRDRAAARIQICRRRE
jgi:hypothetical protein